MIELLVVVAIIGILAALLLSALASTKERAVRIRCMGNIKQIDLVFLSYGHDNAERLPTAAYQEMTGGGAWNFLPDSILETFRKQYGLTPSVLYDPGMGRGGRGPVTPGTGTPGIRPPLLDEDFYYKGVREYYSVPGRFIGYVHTFPEFGTKVNAYCLDPTNWNATITPQPIQIGATLLPAPKSSERVLVAGLLGVFKTPSGVVYSDGLGDYFSRPAHLNKGAKNPVVSAMPDDWRTMGELMPAGDNVGMLDGSAKWRKIKDMKVRSNTAGTYVW